MWWQLDRDHPGFRQVRTEAVADAFRAAEDFAVALGRDLGELTVLADSGLLAAGGGGGGEQPVARMALKMEGAAPGGAALPATDPAPQPGRAGGGDLRIEVGAAASMRRSSTTRG